jgi:DNA repair protein RecN (Recombination protein N)
MSSLKKQKDMSKLSKTQNAATSKHLKKNLSTEKEVTIDVYLESLELNHFAIFDEHKIQFNPHFNCIIGETGSGKSLILDALEFVLGGRAQKSLIRKGHRFYSVQANFHLSEKATLRFSMNSNHVNNLFSIRREFHEDKGVKNFINNVACTSSHIQDISKELIDIIGQFANQSLVSTDFQRETLDAFASLRPAVDQFSEIFSTRNHYTKKLNHLYKVKNEGNLKLDFLQSQIRELEGLNLSAQEESELIQKKSDIQNKLKKQKTLQHINEYLNSDEGGLQVIGQQIQKIIEKEKNVLPSLLVDLWRDALLKIDEFHYELSKDSFNDADLDDSLIEIMERIDLYEKVKKKYRLNISEVIHYIEKIKTEIDEAIDCDKNIFQIQKELSKIQNDLEIKADFISKIRNEKSSEFEKKITGLIQQLKMPDATFKCSLSASDEYSASGKDHVSFLIESNPGEGLYPLREIASGGEMSRILLAIRRVLTERDTISIFFFDEIETGIGGETALTIGDVLKQISKHSQVISITHLPQIAYYADHVIKISKSTIDKDGDEKRTQSQVEHYTQKDLKKILKSMIPEEIVQSSL